MAVEKNLSGGNISNVGFDESLRTDAGMEAATGKKCVYMPVSEIENHLKRMGPGSHLIVGINRRLPNGQSIDGHWFNAFYDGNKIHTIDGQCGDTFDWPYDYHNVSEWCAMI
ncbi:MAG: hypothetical protein IJH40_08580 [Ruminococcus sp.]|nr:hypothetical protein [Ruminococcus sp.]